MKHLFNNKQYKVLNELIVHRDNNVSTQDGDVFFILYKKDLWVFNQEIWEEGLYEEINNTIGEDIYDEDFYSIENTMIDEEKDYILAGSIENNAIYLFRGYDFRHSSVSTDLKKLSVHLNLPIRTRHNYGKFSDSQGEVEIDIVDNLKDAKYYHGTTIKHLTSISKYGLRRSLGKTNYDDIIHRDKLFVTTNIEKASFHAFHSSKTSDDFPIVLEFRIPDVNQLVLDYDIAINYYGKDHPLVKKLGYDKILKKYNSDGYIGNNKLIDGLKDTDVNKKFGVFGYQGNIPSSYINGFLIDIDMYEQWYIDSVIYQHGEFDTEEKSSDFSPIEDWVLYNRLEILKLNSDLEDDYNDEEEDGEYY